MNAQDFATMWQGGLAWLMGGNPYAVEGYYYPLPYTLFMSLWARLPLEWAYGLWVAVCALALLFILRRRIVHWALFMPVIHLFSAGQNELLWWALERAMRPGWRGALFAALITLKPQTALILLPWHLWQWLRHDRATLLKWLICVVVLWGAPLLLQADWLGAWLQARATETNWLLTARNAPSLWSLLALSPALAPLLALVTVPLFLWGMTRPNKFRAQAACMLASPLGLYYTTFALLERGRARVLVPLSLMAFAWTLWQYNWILWLLLPLWVALRPAPSHLMRQD